MIKQIKKIENTGKFYSFSSPKELKFKKISVIYANNGCGKSTLTSVFKSLKENNPDLILGRKTINSNNSPRILIEKGDRTFCFDKECWSGNKNDILIFDINFITQNLYSDEISNEHKKDIHKIIIGEAGIKIEDELVAIKKEEKETKQKIRNLEDDFQKGFKSLQIKDFLSLKDINNEQIDNNIKSLQLKIESINSQIDFNKFPKFESINTLEYYTEDLKTKFAISVENVHKKSKEIVLNHILKNITTEDKANTFIQLGLSLQKESDKCPFCGQTIQESDILLNAYKHCFDDTYNIKQKELEILLNKFRELNIESLLSTLSSIVSKNTLAFEKWKTHLTGLIELNNISDTLNFQITELIKLKNQLLCELEKKVQNLNYTVDFFALESITDYVLYINKNITDYNIAVSKQNKLIQVFLTQAKKEDASTLIAQVNNLQEKKKKNEDSWKKWEEEYIKSKISIEELMKRKEEKEKELTTYSSSIFDKYQDSINSHLSDIGAEFSIDDLTSKSDGRSSSSKAEFCIKILDQKISLASSSINKPHFKNTLSEGDKSTLAFAFFFAVLDKTDKLENKIVVFDDPLSSFDSNRRLQTAELLAKLGRRVKQLFIFTHNDSFLSMVNEKIRHNITNHHYSDNDIEYYAIISDIHGSRLERFDIENYKKHEQFKFIDKLKRYYDLESDISSSEMQKTIRTVFENAFKFKYYQSLYDGANQESGISSILTHLKKKNIIDTQLEENVRDICDITHDAVHGCISENPLRELSRDELKPKIKKTLELLEKI